MTTLDTLAALAPYVSLSREDYYGLSVTIPKNDPITDGDVTHFINNLLSDAAEYTTVTEGEIRDKDRVQLYYRGETLTADGWVDFIGGSNYADGSPYSLVIGSGNFISGFEEALIGLGIGETSLKTVTSTSHVIGEDGITVAYISYSYTYTAEGGTVKRGTFRDRVDLSAASGRYAGTALLSDISGKNVGTTLPDSYTVSFDITGDLVPEEITVTNVRITHAVTEERTYCLTVSFPTSYPSNPALAGVEARFHVVAIKVERPINPELTLSLITEKFRVPVEDLTPFIPEDAEGTEEEKLVAAFRPFVQDFLERRREEAIETAVISAFWERMDAFTPFRYPADLLTEAKASIRAQLESEYNMYVASYGSTMTLEEYVLSYYAVPAGVTDLEGFILGYAEKSVKQRMILYAIAAAEGLELTPAERAELCEETWQEMIDYYNDYYGGLYTFTKQDLIDAGYTEQVIYEEDLYERVCDHVYNSMRDLVVFED